MQQQPNRKPLGQSGLSVSSLLLGTWQAGKRGWIGIDDGAIIEAIQAAVEAGITTLDTAEIYGNGYSEELVGQAIRGRRNQVQLATKVFANHLRYEQVIAACEASLQRLGTDHIELYQIHWPAGAFNSEIVPISDTMAALLELKQQGKILAIGVSNFSLAQLQAAQQYGLIDSLQPPYSLFWRGIEADLLPYCQAQAITILAYSSLAQGLLTGKFGRDHQFPDDDIRAKNRLFQGEVYQQAQTALDQLRPLATAKGCTLAQLAIAWVIAQPQVCAIVGARNSEQAITNATALIIQLSDADIEQMQQISEPVNAVLDTNPVMWQFA